MSQIHIDWTSTNSIKTDGHQTISSFKVVSFSELALVRTTQFTFHWLMNTMRCGWKLRKVPKVPVFQPLKMTKRDKAKHLQYALKSFLSLEEVSRLVSDRLLLTVLRTYSEALSIHHSRHSFSLYSRVLLDSFPCMLSLWRNQSTTEVWFVQPSLFLSSKDLFSVRFIYLFIYLFIKRYKITNRFISQCEESDLCHCRHQWGWSLSTGWQAWSPGHCE